MKNFKADNINELFHDLCNEMNTKPQFEFVLSNKKQRELVNISLLLKNPQQRICTYPQKSLSLNQVAGEFLFHFTHSNKLKFITNYTNYWDHKTDDGKTINSCIGKRIFAEKNRHKITQFDYAYKQLLKRIMSNEATITVYDKHSADLRTKDNPITMCMQFLIRGNKLYLIVTTKKENLWQRFLFNTIFFTIVQEFMLLLLKTKYKDLKLGSFIYNITSLYVYENDFIKVKNLATSQKIDPDFISKQLPAITFNTLNELPIFETYEKEFKDKNKQVNINNLEKIKDKFLIKMIAYLNEGKVYG